LSTTSKACLAEDRLAVNARPEIRSDCTVSSSGSAGLQIAWHRRRASPRDANIRDTLPEISADKVPTPPPADLDGSQGRREDELSDLDQRGGGSMHPTGITANLSVADLAEARDFYVGFLGLSVEGFNLGWVVNLQSPDGRAVVQLVTRDATSPVDSVISVHVGDEVEAAYEEAQRRGFEIVHPLTTEPWGVRRFFVRAPDGNVVNIVNHKEEDG
jgi:catechol 2,3-dioxygenase-like lactoylglutathione lyase family enzyme